MNVLSRCGGGLVKIGSLFSGYGGLDLGVMAVLGGELAWHCENEDAPSKILVHHWPDIPNLGDITKVDWTQVEPVDVITAGWPCQPFSLAGKRKGAEDERALWPEVAAAVRVVRPRLVVLENVAAVVAAGELARAADSLAAIGYDLRWTCLRASDAGAAHRRERFFGIAHPQGIRGGSLRAAGDRSWRSGGAGGSGEQQPGSDAPPHTEGDQRRIPHGDDGSAADPHSAGQQGSRRDGTRRRSVLAAVPGGHATSADTDRDGQPRLRRQQPVERDADRRDRADIAWGIYEPAIRRAEHTFGRSAPEPTEPNPRGGRRLAPRFVEWHMGLPAGWVTDIPGLTRNEQLKALGNGVVPQQAEMAVRWLLSAEEAAA